MIGLFIKDLDVKGGTHKQLLYFLNYLAAHHKPFKVITAHLDYDKTYEGFSRYKNEIVCIHKEPQQALPLKLYSTWRYIRRIKKELKGARVLNVHNLGLELYFPFLYNKNIVWQINDLPESFQVGIHKDQKRNLRNRMLQRYLQWSARSFVKAIAVNVTKNKQRVQENLQMNADVFYCGIESIAIHKDIQQSVNRLKARTLNLLSSGVFFPYRNYETLVEVVNVLKEKGFMVTLNIIGSTELDKQYADKIRALISSYHLEKEVIIRGQITDDLFTQLHAEADVFLFVNVDQSWGLAVFEAMSCGLPAIVSHSVGATEILHDGEDAVFVDPLDAQLIAGKVEWLAMDADTYLRYANAGIAFSKQYTWDNAYSKHMYQLIEKYE